VRQSSNKLFLLAMLGHALRHPRLLFPLISVGWRSRHRDWYRRWPFLPLPPAEYLAWRLHTAFGDEQTVPTPEQAKAFLRWSRWMRG
jgi:hypothetical protein